MWTKITQQIVTFIPTRVCQLAYTAISITNMTLTSPWPETVMTYWLPNKISHMMLSVIIRKKKHTQKKLDIGKKSLVHIYQLVKNRKISYENLKTKDEHSKSYLRVKRKSHFIISNITLAKHSKCVINSFLPDPPGQTAEQHNNSFWPWFWMGPTAWRNIFQVCQEKQVQ